MKEQHHYQISIPEAYTAPRGDGTSYRGFVWKDNAMSFWAYSRRDVWVFLNTLHGEIHAAAEAMATEPGGWEPYPTFMITCLTDLAKESDALFNEEQHYTPEGMPYHKFISVYATQHVMEP